jgi:hypothetical protein
MKKSFLILLILCSFFSLFIGKVSQVFAIPEMTSRPSPIWTTDVDDVLSTDKLEGNVIRDGMYDIVHNPEGDPYIVKGVITEQITDHQ